MLKLSFIYNDRIPEFRALGEDLTRRYNGVAVPDADILIPIGGDGSVLYALPLAKGRPVYGIVPAGSASVAYMANIFQPGDDLPQNIAGAQRDPIYPVIGDITYADQTRSCHEAYSIFALERDSGQAAMLDLTGHFNTQSRMLRLVGDGISFATAIGSTGMAWSHGGPVIAPDRPVMITTGLGLGRPRGFNPIVSYDRDWFEIGCIVSHGKRPLRLNIDGNTLRPADADNPFASIAVRLSDKPGAVIYAQKGSFHPFKRLDLP